MPPGISEREPKGEGNRPCRLRRQPGEGPHSLGGHEILTRDPHRRPEAPGCSPAPLVHAHDDDKREELLHAYRVFVINFRAGVESLKAKARHLIELFPDWAFPPALPFKAAAPAAAP